MAKRARLLEAELLEVSPRLHPPTPKHYRGTSLIRTPHPPRILGMVLLQGPTGWRFLISEVPL